MISKEAFPDWDWNRMTFPDRHVLVCEDNLGQQARAAGLFLRLFGDQGRVQVSFVPGGLQAAAVLSVSKVDLLLLDHDMPNGNGRALLDWMVDHSFSQVPVITFSGIDENNRRMTAASGHRFSSFFTKNKEEVLTGAADDVLRHVLGI